MKPMTAFISPIPLTKIAAGHISSSSCHSNEHQRIAYSTSTPRACGVTPPPPPSGNSNKWTNKSWKDSNSYEVASETVEFVIRPGGIVEETVSGVKGNLCEKLTEDIEEALGKVVSTKKTGEYFEEKTTVTEGITQSTDPDGGNDKWSKWSSG